MVERWNGGKDCYFLVHVGNNCIRVVADISIMHGEIKFWHERYL